MPSALEAVTHPDPWPAYARCRTTQPVFFDERLGWWVVTGYDAVSAALAHPALRVRPPAEPVPTALQGTVAGEVFAWLVRMNDGAFHATHKPGVERVARRWSLAQVARASAAATQDLQPRCVDCNEWMLALPVQAMARLLEVPASDLDATVSWVRAFATGIAAGADAVAVSQADAAATALMAQGRALGLDEVRAANRIAFMQQSLDATAALIGHTVLMLRAHPALAQAAGASLAAMRQFVAEVERHQAPTQNTRRFAGEDLSLCGHAMAQGQGVVVVLAAANRDPAFNAAPDTFEPQRVAPRSTGFGEGAHGCPGRMIAIEIVAAAVRAAPATARFDSYFGAHTGFRPLGNIRSPLFAQPTDPKE